MTRTWTQTGKWLGILTAGLLFTAFSASGEASSVETSMTSIAPAIKERPKPIRLQPVAVSDQGSDAAVTSAVLQVRPPREVEEEMDVVMIEHDADELRDVIRPREDQDYADTVLIFTNTTGRSLKVLCKAWNRAGEGVGRLSTSVPARGVGYLLASDFGNGLDFVGRAHCRASSHLIASAIFLGPEITDLSVVSRASRRQGASDHQFPVVATY